MQKLFMNFLVITCGIIFQSAHLQAQNPEDWANLSRYRAANNQLGAPQPDEKRIVFMGNSITEGWERLHPEFFKDKPYINRGISGQTTPQMLIRFRPDVINLQPAVVLILAGTNDIAGNTGPTTLDIIAGNLFSMAELARAHGIKVILCSVLPAYDYPWNPGLEPAEKIVRLNRMIRKYALQNNIYYLDYFSAMTDEKHGMKEEYSSDGVHPNLEGYRVMEILAEEAISKVLESQ